MYIVLNSCFFDFCCYTINFAIRTSYPTCKNQPTNLWDFKDVFKVKGKSLWTWQKFILSICTVHVYVYLYFYKEYIFQFFVDNTIRKKGILFWKKVKVSPFCNVLSRKINNYRSMNVFIWKYQLLYTCIHLFFHNNDVVQHRNLQRTSLKPLMHFYTHLKKRIKFWEVKFKVIELF